MADAVPPPQTPDEEPLLGRPGALAREPERGERLDRRRFLMVACFLGGGLLVFLFMRLQQDNKAAQQPKPAPPPGLHELMQGATDDPLLKIRSSYAGVDRTPPTPLPTPVTPPPVPKVELPPMATPIPQDVPTRVAPVAAAPATPPPAAAHAVPTPQPKEKPKKWLFANLEQSGAKPPFEKPEKPQEAEKQEGQELLKPAKWVTPEDPTKVLYRSQVIPGLLLKEVNSDIPGQVRLKVIRPVMDSFGQDVVLIPQETIIIGKQEGKPEFGQVRLPVTIEEAKFPNGTLVYFKGQMADKSGALGGAGKVDNHYVKIGVAALLTAALNVGTRAAAGTNQYAYQPSLPQEAAADIGSSINRSGQAILNRMLNVNPTITIPAGMEVTVELDENISFQNPPVIAR